MVRPEDILDFWFNEVGEDGWYSQDEALDTRIRERFRSALEEAAAGAYGLWLTSAKGALAYIILTDQLPRNMFRGQARAFETDKCALAASKVAVDRDWDMRISGPERQFFYMPMMHSESLMDQDRCVRLMCSRMTGTNNLLHAKVHREIIRLFGRFPYRNVALGRVTTDHEEEFLKGGGYAKLLNSLSGNAAAA